MGRSTCSDTDSQSDANSEVSVGGPASEQSAESCGILLHQLIDRGNASRTRTPRATAAISAKLGAKPRLFAGIAPPHREADQLLAVRSVQHWVKAVVHAQRRMGFESKLPRTALQFLTGRVTLHQTLVALGPEWYKPVVDLQAIAQDRLFKYLGDGVDWNFWPQPLGELLQAGASLLRTDENGRLPAHVAARSTSDALGMILRLSPASLLPADHFGETTLDVIDDMESVWLGQWGTAEGLLDAIADAALHCLANLPERTRRTLQRRPKALSVWQKLAGHPHCASLLLAGDSTERKLLELDAAQDSWEVREGLGPAKLRSGLQRVALLRSLASERARELEHLQPEELRLKLLHAEAELQRQAEAQRTRCSEMEQEIDRLRASVLEQERELSKLRRSQESAAGSPDAGRSVPGDAAEVTTEEPGVGKVGRMSAAEPCRDPRGGEVGPEGREFAVVSEIMRMRLVGVEPADLPEELREGVVCMRASLSAAVDRLAHDLYESEVHFIQELLQNADDNRYAASATPALRACLRRHGGPAGQPFFFCANNEAGLAEADVRSICDIARSSKLAATRATTGCKGVGWKSVFRVCDTPHVLSGRWRFYFDSRGLGMLTPQWLHDDAYDQLPEEVRAAHAEGQTVFYLPLADASVAASIEQEMRRMESEPVQLIFMRRLREVHLSSDSGYGARLAVLDEGDARTAAVVERETPGDAAERSETRFQICSEGDVSLALPLVDAPPPQRIFAVLPVRAAGFHFAVQAPFQLTASRADVHRTSDNVRRRDAIAATFLKACTENQDIATNALKFLGSEPVEAFWLPVWVDILKGLKQVPCIKTETGQWCEPHLCLLRGGGWAGKWISNAFLDEACGMHFADADNPSETMRQLGIRVFGFEDLARCLAHDGGALLQTIQRRERQSRIACFTDLYCALAAYVEELPSRLDEVQKLRVFPTRPGCPSEWSTLAHLYTDFCPAVPVAWQEPLVSVLDADLAVGRSFRLLDLVNLAPVTESELEEIAQSEVLSVTSETQYTPPRVHALWCAYAVLRRRFLRDLPPPGEAGRQWSDLGQAVRLPAESEEFLPVRCLRVWSFFGTEPELPSAVAHDIFAFAGMDGMAKTKTWLTRTMRPTVGLGDEHAGSFLEWEAFLWALGCQLTDLCSGCGDGLVEATLKLGRLLSSGDFWQQVALSDQKLKYIAFVIGQDVRRHQWFQQLPVSAMAGVQVTLGEIFLQETFHSVGGDHLPYIEGAPADDARVLALLQRLGVAVAVNRRSLLKCLYVLCALNVQDVGVVADIYVKLGDRGYQVPADKGVILVPRLGFTCPNSCTWAPPETALLEHCSPKTALRHHYELCGPAVSETLQRWVRKQPHEEAAIHCETLLRAIALTKAGRWQRGVPSVSDPENLIEAARIVIESLAVLCDCEELCPSHPAYESCMVAKRYFTVNSMIVLACPSENGVTRARVLGLNEAYYFSEDCDEMESAKTWSLSTQYGDDLKVQNFFMNLLGVRAWLLMNELSRRMVPERFRNYGAYREGARGNDEAPESMVLEGLRFVPLGPTRNSWTDGQQGQQQGSASSSGEAWRSEDVFPPRRRPFMPGYDTPRDAPWSSVPFDPPMPDLQPLTHEQALGPYWKERFGSLLPRRRAIQGECCKCGHDPAGPDSSRPPREWRYVSSNEEGVCLFAVPPHGSKFLFPCVLSKLHVDLFLRVLKVFGLSERFVSFGFDPSGRCVGDEELLLDVSGIARAFQLEDMSQVAMFWCLAMVRTLAHSVAGPALSEGFLKVADAIMVDMWPRVARIVNKP